MKIITIIIMVALLSVSVGHAAEVSYLLSEHQTVDANGLFPAADAAENNIDKFDTLGTANNAIAPFTTTAYIRSSSNKPGRRVRLYLQFDLSGLTSQTITGATLEFDAYSLSEVSSNDLTLDVHQLTNDWDPVGTPDLVWDPAVITSSVTGQSITSGTDTDLYDGGGTGSPVYRNTTAYSLDVANIVKNWQSGDTNHGVVIDFPTMDTINNGLGLDVSSVQLTVQAADTTRPNIILIMADDMGYGDPSYMNASVLQANGTAHPDQSWIYTPNMDAMATQGLRFDRFYSASAVCSPTRASCLTGRNPYRVGVPFANEGYMDSDETPLSELLSAAGYATAHFGKWHLGTMTTLRADSNRGAVGNTDEYHPPWHFDYDVCFATESKVPTYHPYRVTTNGAALPTAFTMDPTLGYTITDANFYGTHFWTMPANPDTAEEGVVVPLADVNNATDGDSAKLITDEAIDFIQQSVSNDTPFFVVLWYHTPHRPMMDPLQSASVDSSATVVAGIEDLDTAIGDLRTELGTLGVRTNTMLWLTSDNGPAKSLDSTFDEAQDPIPERTIRSGGLRDRKASFYEGGIRVPGILEWPAMIPSGSSTSFLSSTSDYFPTILDYLGLSVPDQKALDGISLRPVIEGTLTERPSPIGFLIGGNNPQTAWITQDYKLVEVSNSEWELFDMTLPSHQLEVTPLATETNVASQSQAIQDKYNEMLTDYTAWRATVDTDTAYSNSTTPAVTLSSVSATDQAFDVTITFDKSVEGLSADDLIIAGGSAGAISGSGTSYTVEITPSYLGDIIIRLPQAAAFSADGTPSLPSNELLVDVANTVEVEIIDSTVSSAGSSHTTVDSEDLSPATGENNDVKFDVPDAPFATTLYVRGHGSRLHRRVRAFLQFDLSALDATPVASATLYLNGYSLNDIVPVNLEVIAAAADWSTPSYTLTTQGTVSDGGDVTTGLDVDLVRSYAFDVTEMVAAWQDGSWTNHGMIIRLSSDDEPNGVGLQLTGNDAPRLEVSQVPLKILRGQIITQPPSGSLFDMTYQGIEGATYYLHKTLDLSDPNAWSTIDVGTTESNLINFSPPIGVDPNAFYRLSTESTP